MIPITPPDGTAWSLDPQPTAEGVELVLKIPEMGVDLPLVASRASARKLAYDLLAAAGDRTMRTLNQAALERQNG